MKLNKLPLKEILPTGLQELITPEFSKYSFVQIDDGYTVYTGIISDDECCHLENAQNNPSVSKQINLKLLAKSINPNPGYTETGKDKFPIDLERSTTYFL